MKKRMSTGNETIRTKWEKVILEIGTWGVCFALMFFIMWNVFSLIIPQGSWINLVDGDSMEPAMKDKQIVFSDTGEVQRGDIVTAWFPRFMLDEYPNKENTLLIKRVIGLPGDIISIRSDHVYVNEKILAEDYLTEESKNATFQDRLYNEFVLAEDEYYVLGDNREVSFDSRSFGPIKDTDLLYKQSTKPTKNFYLKAGVILLALVAGIYICLLLDSVLTRTLYKFLLQRRDGK